MITTWFIFIGWLLIVITVACTSRKSNGNRSRTYLNRETSELPKLTIEDMYSPNNKLSSFFKMGNSYSILVSNHIIDKEEFVFADNTINLRNKVGRVLRSYAALEKEKNKDIVIP